MKVYQCTKTLKITDDIILPEYTAFTKDRIYIGEETATPGGEWAIVFTNDILEDHLMTMKWLEEYFELLQK